jgi:diguanylate cyclase (GGDEF)-like protein
VQKVLVVEDSRLFGSVLKKEIESATDFLVDWLQTYVETETIIKQGESDYFAALLDLNLPDAPNGEIVDLLLDFDIPIIVFTGDLSDAAREYIWSKRVAEYVLKEDKQSIEYLIYLLKRLRRNIAIKILIVDDSRFYRKVIGDLLRIHRYQVFEVSSGPDALDFLCKNKDISMVITDYNMPEMTGFELVKKIRTMYDREKLAVIGLSTEGSSSMSAQFIKAGANDFLNKQFGNEEFYCRITQSVVMMENIQRIMELSNKDPLTNLYNRRFFFESANRILAGAKRKQITITVAMLDIDYFKKVNDTFGHDIGDKVLKNLASLLSKRFRETDIVARFGGEEFCVLMINMERTHVFDVFDELRRKIEENAIQINEQKIKYTVSIGICCQLFDTLEQMIKQADLMLYRAKEGGRNRVMIMQELDKREA